MKRWFWLTVGLGIWATHFVGLYLISSAADVWFSAEAPGARLVGLGFSLVCLGAVVGVVAVLIRRPSEDPAAAWEGRVAILGAMLAGISIVWQTIPLAF